MKSGKLHIEDLEGELKDRFLPPRYDLEEDFGNDFCEFIYDCNPKKVCFKVDEDDCQIYKFYKRYGLNYREMFIGSKK